MKQLLLIFTFCVTALSLFGQVRSVLETGKVSYVSSQNVYVKFSSTEYISVGDTLQLKKGDQYLPALVVENKSSISCVCKSILEGTAIAVSDEIRFLKFEKLEEPQVAPPPPPAEKPPVVPESVVPVAPEKEEEEEVFKQQIKGRLSAASYSTLSDGQERHRMRYAFSFRGDNLHNTRFSTDNYIIFRHTLGEWDRVQNNLSDAVKIFALSGRYDFTNTSSLTFGRKINPLISSMGAIDGLQYEHGVGRLKLGAIAGSRPNFADYGVDFNLKQFGAYVSHASSGTSKYQQSTMGFIEQRNGASVDRRFVYFQHSDAILENLNLFTSLEMDLYEKINGEVKNKLSLTNLFASLRYRFSRQLSVSASYDNRKNIVFYESYKNTIDSLFENESRQGLRFGFNLRAHKFITWGVNSGMRFQQSKGNLSRNVNSFLSISRLPLINARASITGNFLETGYLRSYMYGVRLSRDIFKKKVGTDVYFREVHYEYKNSEISFQQHIFGASCSVRVLKKLSLYLYYEGTMSKDRPAQTRINTKIIQRF